MDTTRKIFKLVGYCLTVPILQIYHNRYNKMLSLNKNKFIISSSTKQLWNISIKYALKEEAKKNYLNYLFLSLMEHVEKNKFNVDISLSSQYDNCNGYSPRAPIIH